MNTFLARTGSNFSHETSHYYVGVCNLGGGGGGGRAPALPPPLDPPSASGSNFTIKEC